MFLFSENKFNEWKSESLLNIKRKSDLRIDPMMVFNGKNLCRYIDIQLFIHIFIISFFLINDIFYSKYFKISSILVIPLNFLRSL